MTEKLFDDSTLIEFDAVVTGCDKVKNGYEITLDRSAFFPEGGGQQGDRGMIGDTYVLDTFERAGEVIHICSAFIEVGKRVHGVVDKNIRLRRMQNHSGEHLLMAFIHKMLGYDNVGFRVGSAGAMLDLNGVISHEQLRQCEQQANEAIAEDLPVTISYPDSEELKKLTYRSKLDMTENVRLVTIEEIDVCACCAPHVSSTGKIGLIKVLSLENYKGGTRVYIACGLDALDVFRNRSCSIYKISTMLSAKPDMAEVYVERLLEENIRLKKQIAETERQRAEEITNSIKNDDRKSFCIFTKGLSRDVMREIANRAVLMTDGITGVFGEENNGFGYVIASENVPLRSVAGEINAALDGKGGGSDKMIQGSVRAYRERIEKYFSTL